MNYNLGEALRDLKDAVWEKVEPVLSYLVTKLNDLLTRRY